MDLDAVLDSDRSGPVATAPRVEVTVVDAVPDRIEDSPLHGRTRLSGCLVDPASARAAEIRSDIRRVQGHSWLRRWAAQWVPGLR